MIRNEASNYYYFAVKNLSELNSLGWLRGKRKTIISGHNDFENALEIIKILKNTQNEYQN